VERDAPLADEASGSGVEPGALSALLKQLAADPVGSFEEDWQLGLVPGQMVGRFRLIRELGRGGFGIVFEAQDTALGRRVALKALRTGRRAALRQERLLEEADAVARLSHRAIVTLHDMGRTGEGPYLILELLEGETLAARIAAGTLPVPEVVRIGTEVARALAHAHERGVVHRDLKPGNVFLCRDGAVKVLDFGLSHAFGHRRESGGTPAYMAPEQWTGAPEDERTDVFALGVLLFQLLSGKLPFLPDDGGRAVTGPGPAPALEVSGAPALGDLVGRMLEKDPVKRPRDGSEALRVLEAATAEMARAPVADLEVRTRRPRLRLALLAAMSVAVGAGLAYAAWKHSSEGIPSPGGRPVVVVADLDNQTGDAKLDALAGMLTTSLQQSRHLQVLPRVMLLDLLLASGDARLDARRAREAARRARASALVLPSLYNVGTRLFVDLKVLDLAADRTLRAMKEEVGRTNELPEILDRLSERVRLALGEEPAAVRQTSIQLARTVTPSLEAWWNYTLGLDCLDRLAFAGTFGDCEPSLQAALALDPEFGLASLQLSRLYGFQGRPRDEQKAALAPALRDSLRRIPPHDQLHVKAWEALLEGDDGKAKALLGEATKLAGDDKFLWWLAGEVAMHRDEPDEALPLFRRVHELDPLAIVPAMHLAFAMGSSGDLEGVRGLVRELEALGARPGALAALCYVRLWAEPGRALEACERARSAKAGEVGEELLAIALLDRGERDRLTSHLESMGSRTKPLCFAWYMRVLLLAQEGRWPEFLAEREGAGDPKSSWFHGTVAEALAGSSRLDLAWASAQRTRALDRAQASNLAVHLAYRGDLARAEELAGALPARSPRQEVYRAVRRWREGDVPGAIEQLQTISARTALSMDPAVPAPLYLLGEALAESGRDVEAVEALRRFQAMPITYPSWTLPRSLYFLARSHRRLGQLSEARDAARRLMRLWSRASEDQPLLAEARELSRALGTR